MGPGRVPGLGLGLGRVGVRIRRRVHAVDGVVAVGALPVRVRHADVRGGVLGAVEERRLVRVRVKVRVGVRVIG